MTQDKPPRTPPPPPDDPSAEVDAEPVEAAAETTVEAVEVEDAQTVEEPAPAGRGFLARAVARAGAVARRVRQDPDIDMAAGRAKSLLRRVANRARDTIKRVPVDDMADKLMAALSDPRTVKVVQRVMSTAGSASIRAGFRREPQAKLLFEFAEWCERQTDRGDVMAILLNDALARDGAFAQLSQPLLELGQTDDPVRAFLSRPADDAMIALFRSAQYGLLQTLCRLAALGSGVEAPADDAPQAVLVAFFKTSNIPDEFKPIIDLALGVVEQEAPPEAESGEAAPEPGATPEEPRTTALAARVKSMLPVRSFPPGFRFLVGTWLVFLHSYLSRNMVDAFPNVMEKVREDMERERAQREAAPGEQRGDLDMAALPGDRDEG